jgi:hypothetical protein
LFEGKVVWDCTKRWVLGSPLVARCHPPTAEAEDPPPSASTSAGSCSPTT